MKKDLFILIIAIFLTSCRNKYEIYNEDNQKVAQLLSIDKDLNTAYIVSYVNGYDKDTFKKIAERIAKFYGIEGYYMSFYRKRDIDTAEKLKMEYAEFPVEYRLTPYEYRNEYINKDNDTVAALLWRDGTEGFLYTTQKYTIGDSLLLINIFEHLGLTSCFMYNQPVEITLMSYMDCYSKYDLIDGFLFLDEVHQGDFFSIDGINIKKDEEKKFYVNYITNKYLSHEQMLDVVNANKLSGEQSIVNFYLCTDLEKDYASIQYWHELNKFSFFIFNENKEYEYDIQNRNWTRVREYR